MLFDLVADGGDFGVVLVRLPALLRSQSHGCQFVIRRKERNRSQGRLQLSDDQLMFDAPAVNRREDPPRSLLKIVERSMLLGHVLDARKNRLGFVDVGRAGGRIGNVW